MNNIPLSATTAFVPVGEPAAAAAAAVFLPLVVLPDIVGVGLERFNGC